MNIILLSGGSGKRLWPLSNEIRAKHFIKFFRKPEGAASDNDPYESMVQRVWRQLHTVDPSASVTIATSEQQVPVLQNQLGTDLNLSVEPCRRDTFPAIALACAHLHDVQGVAEDEVVIVCPVDSYVEDRFFKYLKSMQQATVGFEGLVLLGITPTYPSAKYGYIFARDDDESSYHFEFKEKPDEKTAEAYIREGALWNAGVFAFRLSYILQKSKELLGYDRYEDLLANYASFPQISFDYAVAEHERHLNVIRYLGTWKDLGTWNTLTEAMAEPTIGDVRMGGDCENVHAINEMDVPMLVIGCKDLVISASPEGILVSDKHQSSYIKPYVHEISQRVMYAEKSWGSYRVIDVEDESISMRVTLKPDNKMNYHSHAHRDEVWTVIAGSGTAILDGEPRQVKPGDVITMPAGCRHTVIAGSEGLQIIEVQLGSEIRAEDKTLYEFPVK